MINSEKSKVKGCPMVVSSKYHEMKRMYLRWGCGFNNLHFPWKREFLAEEESMEKICENSQVSATCCSKVLYQNITSHRSQKMWWTAIQSNGDSFVSQNKKSGDGQLLVSVLQSQKIRAGISVIFLTLPLDCKMAAAVPVIITSFEAITTTKTKRIKSR